MATKYLFDNKQVMLPGAYSTIKSIVDNPPLVANYGRVLVIDNGTGAEFGGGSGVNGELAQGANSIYRFSRLAEYQNFLKGGLFWKAAQALFKPQIGVQGASEVLHVKAATTVAAKMTFATATGGSFVFKTRDEGIIGNGVVTGTGSDMHLDKGYAFSVESGVRDTAKWILKVWRGSWTGNYDDGLAYDEVPKEDSTPILVAQSPEFDNVQTLIDWGSTRRFNELFTLDSTSAVAGTGEVTSADVSALDLYELASGGTETYASTDLDDVLEVIQDVDYAILLNDQFGVNNYDSALSTKIFTHLRDDAKFMKFMVIGGGANEDEFSTADGSLDIAAYFNDVHALVVHGNVKEASQSAPEGLREWDTLIHSAYIAGRLAGLEPQVPLTNKSINIAGVVHPMTKVEKEIALEGGVICTNYNEYMQTFNVVQGVNTLQDNERLINSNTTSFSIQIMRIVSQINRELVINANTELLSDERGVNMNTLSPGTLVNWTKNYLQSRIATAEQDNLLMSYDNVTVTRQEDSYFVNYEITVNGEITKVFFTGFLLQ